jgi:hypothetical protein
VRPPHPRVGPADDPADGGGDVERYERLRGCALGGELSGSRLGLALLQRRGVAAWAHALRTTAPAVPARPASWALASGEEIVGALATMALACLRGE